MPEKEHPVKRRISISISSSVVTILFLLLWLFIRGKESANELIFVANLILPFLIVLGIIFVLVQLFVLDRMYYLKLTDTAIVVNSVFPVKTFNYKDIKSINFNNGWFKGADTGLYMGWPIVMKLENPEKFLIDFKTKYKKNTGNDLIIKKKLLA